MLLKDFVLALPKVEREAFAERCGTTIGHIKQVMYGNSRCSAELAINIDRESGGEVKCDDLCPIADFAYLRKQVA